MNKSVIRHLAAGWVGALGLILSGQAVLAEPPSAPQMTVYISNRADVERDTLQQAKEVAARIFRNAGLDALLLDLSMETEGFDTSTFIVHLSGQATAKSFHLAKNVLGVAPGTTKDKDRTTVFVFDHLAARLTQQQARARVSFHASKAQILGYAIAHEIAHVLLHQDSHAPKGIMQANWDRNALANIAMGRLTFNPQEVATIQAEVARRGMQQ